MTKILYFGTITPNAVLKLDVTVGGSLHFNITLITC